MKTTDLPTEIPMQRMRRRAGMASLAVLLMALCLGEAFAQPRMWSGSFKPNTPSMPDQTGGSCLDGDKFYHVMGPITVSATGSYLYQDSGGQWGLPTSVSYHEGDFDPANPAASQIDAFDGHGHPDLVAGKEYYMVVQPVCQNRTGTWAIFMEGPGAITAESGFTAPSWWHGTFSETDGQTRILTDNSCPNTWYDQSPPVRVPTTGRYYISEATNWDNDFWLWISIYEGSFDPSNPTANQVITDIYQEELILEAGKDYVFVTQPTCSRATGDWAFMLTPAAEFEINRGLNGAYYDPDYPGQGFLLDILPVTGLAFYAEFTFDTSQPMDGEHGQVGALGNRWFTAQGAFDFDTDVLEVPVYATSGGLFNQSAEVTTAAAGTLRLEFTNGCAGGTRSISLDSGVQAQSTFQRLAGDNLELCEQQYEGPAVVRPLD